MDRINTLAADLPLKLAAAGAAMTQSGNAFRVMLSRVDDGGTVTTAEAEELEEVLDAAGRLLGRVLADHEEMKVYVRRMLLEAGASGWVMRDGGVYKDVDEAAG
jgi:hypothetical protein